MVRSRRKIREGISVISSRRVMVRARFKAGAKNVSASLPPPSHHPHTDTPPLHEIEVNRQSRLFPLFYWGWKLPLGVSGQFLYRIRKQKSIFNYLWAFCVTASLGQYVFRRQGSPGTVSEGVVKEPVSFFFHGFHCTRLKFDEGAVALFKMMEAPPFVECVVLHYLN